MRPRKNFGSSRNRRDKPAGKETFGPLILAVKKTFLIPAIEKRVSSSQLFSLQRNTCTIAQPYFHGLHACSHAKIIMQLFLRKTRDQYTSRRTVHAPDSENGENKTNGQHGAPHMHAVLPSCSQRSIVCNWERRKL